MKKKIILSSVIFLSIILLCFTFFKTFQATKYTDVIRFKEDNTKVVTVSKYKLLSYSINDIIPPTKASNYIWVTYNFLKNKEFANKLKEYIDGGNTILVEGNGFDNNDLYKIFNVEEKNRATKSSALEKENSNTLHTIGILIFKSNDLYYVLQINQEKNTNINSYYTSLFSNFLIDKSKIIY